MTNQPEPIQTGETLAAALEFYNAGIVAVQVRDDGSKAPLGQWKQFQTRKPTLEETVAWFANANGLGIITGAISGNLEMLELEGRAVADGMVEQIKDLCYKFEIGDLWDRLAQTYIETTPSGGIHWLYKISDQPVPGNTKLARRPGENGGVEVLAETRGEGGFVVTAPSRGTIHPSGEAWIKVSGSAGTIQTFTIDERDSIHFVIKCLDSMPEVEHIAEQVKAKEDDGTLSPGDDYNHRAKWEDILTGWSKVFTSNGVTYWRRPGKNEGVSATTGRNDGDNLFVFTTSTTFESEKPYSKFAAYTHLNHAGDFSQAAKLLRKMGYGAVSLAVNNVTQLAPFQPLGDTTGMTDEEVLNALGVTETVDRAQVLLDYEIEQQRARRDAKRHLDEEDHLRTFRAPTITRDLAKELEQPDEETAWQVFEVIPQGANVLLTAAYKSGKTTMVNNLVKSLADNEPFLNKYGIEPHDGRIVVFNYEVDQRQYRQWIRDVNIHNLDKVTLVHLRGMRMPLTTKRIEDYVVELLADLNCHTWIVDPFARAFTGSGEENSNSDVGVFLDTLDVIKERAGISNLVMPAHTGRNQESGIDRARGATRLDDWADVRWILTKNDTGDRFFSADGRDVNVAEHLLAYNHETRQLSVDRQISKGNQTREAMIQEIIDVVTARPGISATELADAIKGNTNTRQNIVKKLVDEGTLSIRYVGQSRLYTVAKLTPFQVQMNA